MKRNELKDLIISEFEVFAVKNGFVNRKDTLWYCVKNNIYICVGFDVASDGYKPVYRVYPLWECGEVMHISYGKNFLFRTGFFTKEVRIISDRLSCADVIKSIRSIKKFLIKRIIPMLSKISDADSLGKIAKSSNLIVTNDFRKLLLGYCDAYNGDYENAVRLFEEYISRSGNPDNYKEEANLVCIMKNTPDKVKEYLQSNIDKMVKQENLLIIQRNRKCHTQKTSADY